MDEPTAAPGAVEESAPRGEGASLLAVDLGVRAGLALFGRDGRLRWQRSQNFGNLARLRRAVPPLLRAAPSLAWLVLEGGGAPAQAWEREAAALGVPVRRVQADHWREALLYPRERRTGREAKQRAEQMARRIAVWSGARVPKTLRHDAAEAVLLGLWAVLDLGWLPTLPPELRRGD